MTTNQRNVLGIMLYATADTETAIQPLHDSLNNLLSHAKDSTHIKLFIAQTFKQDMESWCLKTNFNGAVAFYDTAHDFFKPKYQEVGTLYAVMALPIGAIIKEQHWDETLHQLTQHKPQAWIGFPPSFCPSSSSINDTECCPIPVFSHHIVRTAGISVFQPGLWAQRLNVATHKLIGCHLTCLSTHYVSAFDLKTHDTIIAQNRDDITKETLDPYAEEWAQHLFVESFYRHHILIVTKGQNGPEDYNEMVTSALETAAFPERISFLVALNEADNTAKAYQPFLQSLEQLSARNIHSLTMPDGYYHNHFWSKWQEWNYDVAIAGSDDMVFETPNWDKAIDKMMQHYDDQLFIGCFSDSHSLPTHMPFSIVPKALSNALGYFFPRYFHHLYANSWLMELAGMCGRVIYDQTIKIKYPHTHSHAPQDVQQNATTFRVTRQEREHDASQVFTQLLPYPGPKRFDANWRINDTYYIQPNEDNPQK